MVFVVVLVVVMFLPLVGELQLHRTQRVNQTPKTIIRVLTSSRVLVFHLMQLPEHLRGSDGVMWDGTVRYVVGWDEMGWGSGVDRKGPCHGEGGPCLGEGGPRVRGKVVRRSRASQ